MPLTPQDVRNKLFTSVRLRPGYDEDEVDAFLDEVEQELGRLLGEIEELKGGNVPASDLQLAAARQDAETRLRAALDDAEQRHQRELAGLRAEHEQALSTATGDADGQLRAQLDAAQLQRQQAEARLGEAAQQLQAHQQQARALQAQLQQLQDRAVRAEQELERIRAAGGASAQPEETAAAGAPTAAGVPDGFGVQVGTETGLAPVGQPVTSGSLLPPPSPTEDALRRTLLLAQRTADEAVAEARAEAQRIVGDAQRHAAETTRRAEAEHNAAVARARADYELLAGKVEELRSFERDYRSRLRAYLRLQLRDLEAGAPEPTPAVTAPARSALTDGRPAGPQPGGVQELQHSDDDRPLRPSPLYGNGQPGPDAR